MVTVKEMIKYLTDRYDELTWQAQHVEPLKELNIWGQHYSERWSHSKVSFRGEDGAAYELPEIEAHVHFNQWEPGFVLAQIAALRAVVAMAEEVDSMATSIFGEWGSWPDADGEAMLKALLQPFSGRKDFPAEWKA